MANISKTPTSEGTASLAVGDLRKPEVRYARVSITEDSSNIQLPFVLPAKCKNVWFTFVNQTAVSVAGDGTGTADSFAIANSNATGVSTATSTLVAIGGTTLTEAAQYDIEPNITANTSATAQNLYLIPVGTGSRKSSINTNPTAGFHFDATATVDVVCHFETFEVPA
jgi:hypothetical protein